MRCLFPEMKLVTPQRPPAHYPPAFWNVLLKVFVQWWRHLRVMPKGKARSPHGRPPRKGRLLQTPAWGHGLAGTSRAAHVPDGGLAITALGPPVAPVSRKDGSQKLCGTCAGWGGTVRENSNLSGLQSGDTTGPWVSWGPAAQHPPQPQPRQSDQVLYLVRDTRPTPQPHLRSKLKPAVTASLRGTLPAQPPPGAPLRAGSPRAAAASAWLCRRG